ncbi:MAG: DUF1206 domain-containing protein [Chloroflexi bacterium AL-W]|nr:DUF1206 domain-containing protein [Chloroflexi bacterium AL-N1]NOK68110.1 DUF1206 domain-containing protein [Chloroflexi bacterium AL-N10]NOK73450.1 DUF1206 domain-containing protein [Chloroflexi bacterium AL-N5]NOK83364.1 DUF1206 domain-containing protein [Chloroflexi bacterium AL-W]NOK87781.1 DUF1206 domain-containing protein [Chloroflexi bacterium AL-N15]
MDLTGNCSLAPCEFSEVKNETERLTSIMASQDVAADKAQEAADHPWVENLARGGYAAKGIVYIVIGILATLAAFGPGGETTDSQGALQTIASQPFGRLLLGIVGVGLIGYVLWRVVEGVADPNDKGTDPKGLFQRLGYVISGLTYAGLAFTAFSIALGTGSGGGDSRQDWTARLLEQPFGPWLVGLVGCAIIGVGLWQFYDAYKAEFREKLDDSKMSQTEKTWVTRIGRVGRTARGITFSMIGAFFIQAAIQFDPSEAKGLSGALSTLAQQPFGPWLLGIVAIGLVAYGTFMLARARYEQIPR